MAELPTIIISTLISVILFVAGFVLGGRQTRETGHNIAENILDILQRQERGEIEYTVYDRTTSGFEFRNPDATTGS